jgi:hypothetical protein
MRDSIKAQLRPLRPTSLTSAYWQARDMEQCQPAKKTYNPQFQKFSGANTYKPPHPVLLVVSKVPEQNSTRPMRPNGSC